MVHFNQVSSSTISSRRMRPASKGVLLILQNIKQQEATKGSGEVADTAKVSDAPSSSK